MIVSDIRHLLEKLNDTCTQALESAVGRCVSRGHYEVRWDHLLAGFLDADDGEITLICRHFGVDNAALRKGVNTELEALPTGNTGKPSFSPPFLETMEQAWSLCSLNLGLTSITSGALFTAAVERGLHAMAAYADALRPIRLEALKTDFHAIVSGSAEQKRAAAPGTPPAAAANEAVLEQFCTNFTKLARDGAIDPILGRDDEIRKSLDILTRRRKNNPILVGEAGVGKTAIVEGLALRIANGDVPDHLKNVDLWGLDLGLLQAGASVKGEFEKRLKNVIDAIKASARPTILFIDEAHTLIGAGGSAGQNDAANLLKPALARGELRTMAATTWSEYRRYFEKDPALARRFQLVSVDEPTEEKCCIMLRGIAASYEKHHGVRITYEGIRSAVTFSNRYISGRQLPDKAVDVLDTAAARVKMSQTTKPASLDGAERALLNSRLELKTLLKDQGAGISGLAERIEETGRAIAGQEEQVKVLTTQWEAEKTLVAKIIGVQDEMVAAAADTTRVEMLRGGLDGLTRELEATQGENPMVFPHVSAGVCGQVVGDWTGIPVGSLLKDEAQTLLDLDTRIGERVLGQDEAIAEIASAVRSAKTGMGNPDAPLGVFLFTGPSGVGKTEAALALADLLFGGEKFLTVINMSEYQEKHTVSQLKGSPPGYVGYGEGGILTEAVRQKPYSLVLLDEVEKAHLEVMNLFYQVFDKGFMRDGEGREINFRNTLIIMTSNLGSDTIVDLCADESAESPATSKNLLDAIRPQLSAHFQPALLGRCKVIPFRPLSKEIMRGVVALKLDKLASRIGKAHSLAFSCSPELIDQLAESCTTVESGARNADLVIDQNLTPAISRQLLQHMGEEGKKYSRLHVQSTAEGDFEILFSEADDGDLVVNHEPEFKEKEPAGEKKKKKQGNQKK